MMSVQIAVGSMQPSTHGPSGETSHSSSSPSTPIELSGSSTTSICPSSRSYITPFTVRTNVSDADFFRAGMSPSIDTSSSSCWCRTSRLTFVFFFVSRLISLSADEENRLPIVTFSSYFPGALRTSESPGAFNVPRETRFSLPCECPHSQQVPVM
jgi:hypothetical protein